MSDEMTLLEQRIREKAFELWEAAGRPEGQQDHFWFQAELTIDQEEERLDEALADSFPASDPLSSP